MFNLATTPFAPSSNWNTPVGTDATYSKLNWPASDGYNYAVNWDSYSPAVYVASPTDPLVQVSVPASWGYPGGTVSVHMPTEANRAAGTDGELLVIDGDTVYNFWEFNRSSATTATADAYGQSNVTTGSGWGSASPFLSAGTTAAGSSELGGLLVQAETDTGQINHALQLVVDSNLVKPGFTGAAIAGDGGSASGIVQEGDHLAISPDTPMPSGLSALGQEVFHALQQYGAYVVDVAGGTTVLRAQANAYDQTTMTALWHDMGSITPLLAEVTGGTPASPTATSPSLPPTSTSTSASGSGMTDPTGAPTDSAGTPATDTTATPATDTTATPVTDATGTPATNTAGTSATNVSGSETGGVSGNPSGSGSSGPSPTVGSHGHHHSGSSDGSATDATDTWSTSHHHHDHQAQTDFWSAFIDTVHNLKSAPAAEAAGAVQLDAAGLGSLVHQVQGHGHTSFDGAHGGIFGAQFDNGLLSGAAKTDASAVLHALHDMIAAAHCPVAGNAIPNGGGTDLGTATTVAATTGNMDFGHDHGQNPGHHQHFELMWHHA